MMSHPSFWQLMWAHLHQPEYLHVLLNPLPIYAIPLGALALVLAMAMRSRPAQITALVILLIGAGSTIPVIYFGDKGYDNVEATMPNDQADAWLDAHGQRALKARPGFYALLAVTALALALPWKWPRAALPLNVLTLGLAAVCFGLVSWIAFAGGQAMHEEFRGGSGMPPEPLGGYDKVR